MATELGEPAPLTDLLARYYDPSTAQFLTVDPAVATTGQPYSYAGDSPVNNVDPTGLWCWPPWSSSCDVPIADQFVSSGLGQFLNGWANGATLGASSAIENLTPNGAANVAADQCSGLYLGGEWSGAATTVALTWGLGGEAEAAASTGRTEAANLSEQLAMESAQADPEAGLSLPVTMTDPNWPASAGWIKMAQNINGVEIHYVYNTVSGAAADFKFVP